MFNITNKTERLITTHLGDMLPPGVAVAVTEDTMTNSTMQEWATAGHIEVVEIVDPPIITRAQFVNPPKEENIKEVPPEANQVSPLFNTGDVEQPQTKVASKVEQPPAIQQTKQPAPVAAQTKAS